MRWLSVIALASMLAPTVGRAQVPDSTVREVRAVVDSFFAAFDAERWPDAARFIDLPGFARWFEQLVSTRRSQLPFAEPTVDDLMEQNPGMPRAAAEWELSRMRQRRGGADEPLTYQFAGIGSFRELQALRPDEAATRWLEAQGERHHYRRSLVMNFQCPAGVIDSLVRAVPQRRTRVLGVIVPRSGVAFALFERDLGRERALASDVMPPSVIRLRRMPEGWRIPVGYGQLLQGGVIGISIAGAADDCRRRP